MQSIADDRRQFKIFNIGFHKTGTSSLTYFMKEHRLRVLHNTAYCMKHLGLGQQNDAGEDDGIPVDVETLIMPGVLQRLVQEYDFFSDNPWPLLFRRLDREFPGSRFILTRRRLDNWTKSLLKHTGTQNTRMRRLIYGYGNPEHHIDRYQDVYTRHNQDVIDYFSNKENLLVIDIEEDDRLVASKLNNFIGIGSNDKLFPTINKRLK